MRRRTRHTIGLLALLQLALTVETAGKATRMDTKELRIGGVGGAYLLADPGPLQIELTKWDRNSRRNPTHLRAILVGPDREVMDEIVIPDDGQNRGTGLGPAQHATLKTDVPNRGIYAVNVTVSNDRYGQDVLWSISTNCSRYLIETSRGHRDARHLEPIVVEQENGPADICFAARPGAIEVEVEAPPGASAPLLFDGNATQVASLDPDEEGKSSYTIETGDRTTDKPWRLHIPDGAVTVHIDGVTRWDGGEPYENLSLWSPSTDTFFPFHDLRWMLTPYQKALNTNAGLSHEIEFVVHNNGRDTDVFSLDTESDDLSITLSDTEVNLAADASATVIASVTTPDGTTETLSGRVTVTSRRHPAITTWSTIEARIGGANDLTFDGPLVYTPYRHENEQFAYAPDYPNENQLYFSPDNLPYLRSTDAVIHLDNGEWTSVDTVVDERYRLLTSKVAFGADGEICLLGRRDGETYYLVSQDGQTFEATLIPKREAKRQQWDIEQFSGANTPDGLAPFVRATETGKYNPANFWRHVNDLELFLPKQVDGEIVIGDPILLSTQAIGISSHSGIPSAIVSRGDRVHIVWGEATDPDGNEPGVPAYVATYDRSEKKFLGEKSFVGFGPPANDVHNTPSIVIDSQGYLHTLTGTHGQPFAYAKSLEPNTAHGGFTEPELVEEELRSTYIGFVCDPDDTLHLVFRTWKTDGEYHPYSHYANLAYKRKKKDGTWEPMKRLAVAPFTEYSIWYHRLTIDRKGRLFVSFDYWSTFWFYRVDHYGNTLGRGRAGGGGRRKTIWSGDGGEKWKLLETQDLM
ncbi:MAG: hypothetical protein CME19_07020 [Gemmatimonadetes bacterium]|nr:hypothetical protein [Gemmatimonadota bacterium]